QVLLDSGLGALLAQVFDVGGDVKGLNAVAGELAPIAPIRKLRHSNEVGTARVPVADMRREVFPKAFPAIRRSQKHRRQMTPVVRAHRRPRMDRSWGEAV